MIKRQLIELIAQETVKSAPEIAVQSDSRVTIDVRGRVSSRTCVLRSLSATVAGSQLCRGQRLQTVVVGESEIHRQVPDSRQRMLDAETNDIGLSSRE